ncbi:MBL fold metallo-hydrolase [Pontibacillus yanchengensis]|uniref:MBL fold metallo-hydrolase n=2 Tax=Pontibacillus yanchengensis TaxID=462910 RepID=A0ACC7VCU6_9BACI|nr:MBL fold metallo-hydrolase [Pontibacillus yanchengensis]MYL32151.1 MBL fold metallo-hydrolase [Pontibacillus yanchengensis]MYL52731.1 MBL fold metallo-hydrolase [Pontibacillus yanchengensis]
MKVTKLDQVYMLSFMPTFFPVNCYFVEGEKSLTLIDAGMPFSKKPILKAAEEIGKPIQRIVLTHAHTDHVGALDGLKEALPTAEVLLPERELKILDGDLSLEEGEGDSPIKGGVPKNIQTKPDTLLKDGDRIGSLLAIHAPGHTPGLMAFLDERSNSLIAGDALQTKGGVAVAGDMRWSFPFPALATWNKQVAIETAERLMEYKPSLLAVGHGKWIHNPEGKIRNAIKNAKQSLQGE